jgi:hypothetical protein
LLEADGNLHDEGKGDDEHKDVGGNVEGSLDNGVGVKHHAVDCNNSPGISLAITGLKCIESTY